MPLHFFKRILALAFLLALTFASTSTFSQGGYTRPNTSYGTRMYRTAVDSTFYFPTGCGAPSLLGYDLKMANIYYDSCGTAMYVRNPKTNTWTELAAGGSTVYVDTIFLVGDSALYYTKDGVDYLVANLKDAVTGGNDSLRAGYIDSTMIDSYFIPIAFPDGYFHADTSLRWQPSTGALLVGRNGALVQLQVKGRIAASGAVDIGGGLTVSGMSTTTDSVNYKPVVQNTMTKEFRRMTSYPGQVLASGNGVKVDGSTVRFADSIRQTTEIKVAYDSGANNLQINGYRDGTNNRMGVSIEPDYNRVSIGAYQPGGSSLIQVNTDGTVNLIGRPLNLYLDTMRLIQTGTSTAYAPLATDMSKYRVVMIDKTTGALVSVVKDSIGTSGTAFSSDSLASRRVGPGNRNHIVSWNTTSTGGTTATLSSDVSKDSANIFIGNQSGAANTTGVYNVGIGNSALRSNISGSSNLALGTSALSAVTVSDRNTAFGQSALLNFNGGSGSSNNTAFGTLALSNLTTGTNNIAIGSSSGTGLSDQSHNIMIGSNTGGGNATNRIGIGFIGSNIGAYSLIIDNSQGSTHSTGGNNTHVGYNSSGGGTGIEQSHFGLRAGSGVTGTGNTALGVNAIGSYPGSTTHTGTYNTAVGHNSGYNSSSNITGDYNAAIGNSVQWPSASGSSQLAIGGNAVRWVTRFTSGNFQLNTTASNVSETSGAALHITGTGAILLPSNTATQASAITPQNGMIIYVTSTDATFTAVGFWGRENGTWIKL